MVGKHSYHTQTYPAHPAASFQYQNRSPIPGHGQVSGKKQPELRVIPDHGESPLDTYNSQADCPGTTEGKHRGRLK